MFFSRCKKINIPEIWTTNIKKLHSVHTRILNIIITEHDFELSLNHLCSLPSADLGGHDLEFQQVKLINSMFCTGLGNMLLIIIRNVLRLTMVTEKFLFCFFFISSPYIYTYGFRNFFLDFISKNLVLHYQF